MDLASRARNVVAILKQPFELLPRKPSAKERTQRAEWQRIFDVIQEDRFIF